VLACLFSVFAALTKSEGLGLAIINVVVLFGFLAFKKTWAPETGSRVMPRASLPVRFLPGFWFTLALLLLLSPWLLWSRGLAHTHEASASRLAAGLPNVWIVLRGFAAQFVEFNNWGGMWLLLLFAVVLGWKGFRLLHIQALWFLLLAHLALYAVAYLMTSYGVRELLNYSLDRVLLHATPVVIYLIGYHWAGVSNTSSAAGSAVLGGVGVAEPKLG
jgi:hypothetical protein